MGGAVASWLEYLTPGSSGPGSGPGWGTLGSLSMHVFETRTATGRELFSLLICLQTTTFTLLSIFSPLEMIHIKIWETPPSWYEKCPLPIAIRVSQTRVLKLPIVLCSWARHFTLTVPLSTQVYKWVPAKCWG